MAAPRTPTPPAPPTELGTFVSSVAVGFVAPTNGESARILRAMQELPQGGVTTNLLKDLLLIKQLAPRESAGLLIYPAPMVLDFVRRLKTQLTLQYYRGV